MRNVSLGNHQREPFHKPTWDRLYGIAYCSYAVQHITVQNSTGLKQAEEKMMIFTDMINMRGLKLLAA